MSPASPPEPSAESKSAGPESTGDSGGGLIVAVDLAATLVFAATAVYAAAVFDTAAQWVSAVTAMTLFSIGVIAFLWSFAVALQRSRSEHLSVAEVYLLMGKAIPTDVKTKMNLLIVAQFAIALATSLWRPNGPNGAPGSALVVGFLVPMLGFGLNGIWATRFGRFEPRNDADPVAPGQDEQQQVSTTSNTEIRQNARHG